MKGKKKLLIENYYKFLETHPKYFKSSTLLLDRYGFRIIGGNFRWKISYKPRSYINDILKLKGITKGHIVYRWTTATDREPYLEIWCNNKILDKYGKELR